MNQGERLSIAGAGRTRAQDAAHWLDAFKRRVPGRLLPLLGLTLQAAWADIDRRMQADTPADALRDDRAQVYMLRADLVTYEQRWQQLLMARFDGWPRPPTSIDDSYALLSEDDLQLQLVGQPVMEAMERRFSDPVDLVDSRLRSLASALGSAHRPANPLAPRVLIETLMQAIPSSECAPSLRYVLLRAFERVGGERLGAFYAALNAELAEAGYALQAESGYGVLPLPAREQIDGARDWGDADGAPHASHWRDTVAGDATGAIDTLRGGMLRRWARMQHPHVDADDPRRALRDKEFLAVLSLLQGDPSAAPSPDVAAGGVTRQLREQIVAGAASLGIDRASTRVSDAQQDAIALGGTLVDAILFSHALDAQAAAMLARLAYPLARAALIEPAFFDRPTHPLRVLPAELMWAWDGNARDRPEDIAAFDAALRAATAVIEDAHGNDHAAADALRALQADLDPLRTRAATARGRIVQSLDGRERLEQARIVGDDLLFRHVDGQELLPCIATFLAEQWRHALVQAWLRDGPQSRRFAQTVALAASLVQLDALAATGDGAAVADRLLRLEVPMRDSLQAGGLGAEAADHVVASLVREIANPDAVRAPCAPAAWSDARNADRHPLQGRRTVDTPLVAGQWICWRDPGTWRRLQVAWVSASTGDCVLVNRAGQRVAVFDGHDVRGLLDDGSVRVLPEGGPVEALFVAWERHAQSAPAG